MLISITRLKMDTIQLIKLLQNDTYTKRCFGMVCPSNHLPSSIKRVPMCIIVNTDPSYKPGRHWLALYIDQNRNLEFFDSYGFDVEKYSFVKNFLIRNEMNLSKWNTRQLQGSLSSTCGQFCLYFLFWRSRDIPFEKIMSSFGQSTDTNDIFVTSFVNSVTGASTNAYDVEYILNQCCRNFVPLINLF